MIQQVIINKETTKPYVSKEGKTLIKNVLESGDVFVPKINQPIKREGKFISYSIPAEVLTSNGKLFDEIFLELTTTQANTIIKTEDANQKRFVAYEYKNEYGVFVGISTDDYKKAKKLSEFE
jgi:hypothetical protein